VRSGASAGACRLTASGNPAWRGVSGDRVVLVSSDGQRLGLPGGRPEQAERWVDTLRREVAEEARAVVKSARLLGFTRGRCVRGPQEGQQLR